VLVVIYGLFHGLVFFPVLLSLIGPKSFDISRVNSEIPISAEELEPQLQCKDSIKDEFECTIIECKTNQEVTRF